MNKQFIELCKDFYYAFTMSILAMRMRNRYVDDAALLAWCNVYRKINGGDLRELYIKYKYIRGIKIESN